IDRAEPVADQPEYPAGGGLAAGAPVLHAGGEAVLALRHRLLEGALAVARYPFAQGLEARLLACRLEVGRIEQGVHLHVGIARLALEALAEIAVEIDVVLVDASQPGEAVGIERMHHEHRAVGGQAQGGESPRQHPMLYRRPGEALDAVQAAREHDGAPGPARAEHAAVDRQGLALGTPYADRARVVDDAVTRGEGAGAGQQHLARAPVARREAVGGGGAHVGLRAAVQMTSIARPSRPATPRRRVRQRSPARMGCASTRVPVLTMSPGASRWPRSRRLRTRWASAETGPSRTSAPTPSATGIQRPSGSSRRSSTMAREASRSARVAGSPGATGGPMCRLPCMACEAMLSAALKRQPGYTLCTTSTPWATQPMAAATARGSSPAGA